MISVFQMVWIRFIPSIKVIRNIYSVEQEINIFDFRFVSGGAGYVLSRSALQSLHVATSHGDSPCNKKTDGREDVELGNCLSKSQVETIDPRDESNSLLFIPASPGALSNKDTQDLNKQTNNPDIATNR